MNIMCSLNERRDRKLEQLQSGHENQQMPSCFSVCGNLGKKANPLLSPCQCLECSTSVVATATYA